MKQTGIKHKHEEKRSYPTEIGKITKKCSKHNFESSTLIYGNMKRFDIITLT